MFVRVDAEVLIDTSGLPVHRPSLLTPTGHLEALLNYFLVSMPRKSVAWAIKMREAVILMLEYIEANPGELNKPILFQNFVLRLYSGTFTPSSGMDSSGLGWKPRSERNVRETLHRLNQFFLWMGEENSNALQLNPTVEGSTHDRRWAAVAYQYRKQKAMLGHVWPTTMPSVHHRVEARRPTDQVEERPPSFPDDRFEELLDKGFKVGDSVDHRCCCITLLLHGAGFRPSEPFHLYPQDVIADPFRPERAVVRIYHPSQGQAPADWVDGAGKFQTGTRAAFLADRYGLAPRHQVLGRTRVGWKGSLVEGRGLTAGSLKAYWFEPELAERFMYHWNLYLHQLAQLDRAHPWAFVNLNGRTRGEPYNLGEFDKAHARACERIGLQVAKHLGTSLHGHRHAYGQRLEEAGFDPRFIQRFMHHASEDSQRVYTAPSPEYYEQELQAGLQRLKASRKKD